MVRAIDVDVLANKIMEIWDRAENEGRTDIANFIANIIVPCIVGTPTIEPKQEWISVKDGLPEKDTLVLCVGAKGGMFLGYIRRLYGDDKTAYVRVPNARSGRYAAFWMPLPEPPEKNNEEEQA